MARPKVVEYSGVNEILRRDEQTGIQCGINDLGRLFIGDRLCWYNMEDTPENRKKLLADFEEAVEQRKAAQLPAKVTFQEAASLDYKFQVNAAHIKAIYDELDGQLKRYGRRHDAAGIEVSSFLAGAKAALSVISANTNRVWDWCHIQEVDRRYFDQDE
ncbi:MAG: hypothetical protein IKU26_03160 [Clostridia bacterium]|nr:hypothetical protein [Clostridia bacterium]